MYWIRRFTILLTCVLVFSFLAWALPRALDPTGKTPEKRARDRRWVNSSPYFLDRQACRWVSLCGLHHLRKDPASRGNDYGDDPIGGELKRRSNWEEGAPRQDKKRNLEDRRRILNKIPDYVTKYAPLVHLYSGEEFWPSDIKEHVEHMTVYVDGEVLNTTGQDWNLHNLHELDKLGDHIILRSTDDVESRPHWLHSHENVPNPFEDDPESGKHPAQPHTGAGSVDEEPTSWFDIDKNRPLNRISDPRGRSPDDLIKQAQLSRRNLQKRGHKPDSDGYSNAPAILLVVDKGHGIVDAFWFFFYSYNLGQTVLGLRFGNHVGDWEHCMVRFENGIPRGVFFSEHEGGQAYAWDAVEKSNTGRPVIYSAVGSHAMYALPGNHPYILPFHMLKDVTDKGPLWDPSLNNYAYHLDYDPENPPDDDDEKLDVKKETSTKRQFALVPAASNPDAPTSWFHFEGRWGDEVYSLADPRQWRLFGQYHYVTGPDGPRFKQLRRSKLCQRDSCHISYKLDPYGTWY